MYSSRGAEVCADPSTREGGWWEGAVLTITHFLWVVGGCSFNYYPLSAYCQVPPGEIDCMITTVDRNRDGKISYSEFR